MRFSKGLHIFVRGMSKKARKENNTAYPGKIPSKSSKVLKKFGTLSCIMTIMNIHIDEDHMNTMTLLYQISICLQDIGLRR